jgi:hypothetical protein
LAAALALTLGPSQRLLTIQGALVQLCSIPQRQIIKKVAKEQTNWSTASIDHIDHIH